MPRAPLIPSDDVRAQELCRTAWALGRLGLGGIFGHGPVVDTGGGTDGGGESEDGGYGSALDGGEMSRLMDKLVGECSKWLEIFTPQVLLHADCSPLLRARERELKHDRP